MNYLQKFQFPPNGKAHFKIETMMTDNFEYDPVSIPSKRESAFQGREIGARQTRCVLFQFPPNGKAHFKWRMSS